MPFPLWDKIWICSVLIKVVNTALEQNILVLVNTGVLFWVISIYVAQYRPVIYLVRFRGYSHWFSGSFGMVLTTLVLIVLWFHEWWQCYLHNPCYWHEMFDWYGCMDCYVVTFLMLKFLAWLINHDYAPDFYCTLLGGGGGVLMFPFSIFFFFLIGRAPWMDWSCQDCNI